MADSNIFVSYARADTDYVIKLSSELKDAGADLWLDQLDIPVGATWDLEIENALEACNCLLFVVSQKSASSNNVLNEVYYALEQNKRVLPVKINDCKIPFRIQRLQYIDLSSNYDEGFKHLLRALNLAVIPKTENPKAEPVSGTGGTDEALKIQAEKEAKLQREENLWQEAQKVRSVAAYKDYFKQTELKKYWAKAQAAIDELNRQEEAKRQSAQMAQNPEVLKPSDPGPRLGIQHLIDKKKNRIFLMVIILAVIVVIIVQISSTSNRSEPYTPEITSDSTATTVTSDSTKMTTDTSAVMARDTTTTKMASDTTMK